jgi:ATP-dependent protease Clp ATPase subunit
MLSVLFYNFYKTIQKAQQNYDSYSKFKRSNWLLFR